jgi:hypothetical protein
MGQRTPDEEYGLRVGTRVSDPHIFCSLASCLRVIYGSDIFLLSALQEQEGTAGVSNPTVDLKESSWQAHVQDIVDRADEKSSGPCLFAAILVQTCIGSYLIVNFTENLKSGGIQVTIID